MRISTIGCCESFVGFVVFLAPSQTLQASDVKHYRSIVKIRKRLNKYGLFGRQRFGHNGQHNAGRKLNTTY